MKLIRRLARPNLMSDMRLLWLSGASTIRNGWHSNDEGAKEPIASRACKICNLQSTIALRHAQLLEHLAHQAAALEPRQQVALGCIDRIDIRE
jgi:hypothetical protein